MVLLYQLVSRDIDLYANSGKIELKCFNNDGDITSLYAKLTKLIYIHLTR